MFSFTPPLIAGRRESCWGPVLFPWVLMCCFPKMQMGNNQLASYGGFMTHSFRPQQHMDGWWRDKQRVNAPGVCVITSWPKHASASAPCSCVCAHTQMRRNAVELNKFVYSTLARLRLSGEDSGKERESEQKERQDKEGGSKKAGYDLSLSIFYLLAMKSGSFSIRVTHSHSQGGIRDKE